MKKLLLLVLSFCLLGVSACGGDMTDRKNDTTEESSDSGVEIEASSEETTKEAVATFLDGRFEGRESIKLVALGDSIARGFGLANPDTQAYPAILSSSIEALLDGVEVDYMNMAVDGMKTDGLLTLLDSSKIAIGNADIVTLCIGANNILQPFISSISGAGGLFSSEGVDEKALESFIDKTNTLLGSEQFVKNMQKGVEQAARDLPRILQTIKSYAPDAIIAVTTVFSPYHGMVLSIPYLGKSVNLGEASDKWVALLNEQIKATVETEGCLLVDAFAPFAEREGLINAAFNLLPPKISFDPHPNINGHILLSNLYLEALSKT